MLSKMKKETSFVTINEMDLHEGEPEVRAILNIASPAGVGFLMSEIPLIIYVGASFSDLAVALGDHEEVEFQGHLEKLAPKHPKALKEYCVEVMMGYLDMEQLLQTVRRCIEDGDLDV